MSKTILVKAVSYLVEKMPDKKKEFEFTIGDNDTIADCLVALGLPIEDDYIVLVNGKNKPLNYCPLENETITIMYLVLGG